MSKNFLTFFSFNQKIETLQNFKHLFLPSFGPLGKFAIFFDKNKEVIFLIKAFEIMEAMGFSNNKKEILTKIFFYLVKKNHSNSGDSSIRATLLFIYLFENSLIFLESGHNNILLSKGIQKLALFSSQLIFRLSRPIQKQDHLKGILQTTSGKKERKDLLDFLELSIPMIRKDALILIEENEGSNNEIEEIQGIQIDKGFASSYFINDIKNFQASYQNAFLLICPFSLDNISQIAFVLNYSEQEKLPLIIIVESISKELLSILILQNIKKKIKLVVIKYSSLKCLKNGLLEDLSILTHASYLENIDTKKESFQYEYSIKDLGFVNKVTITKNKSSFFVSKFSKLLASRKINELSRELLLSETTYEKEICQRRISRLKGNILKCKIGLNKTISLVHEKKKIENLFFILQSSLEEGYLIGGGSFYLQLFEESKNWSNLNLIGDEIYASQIVINSLRKIFFNLYSKSINNPFKIFNTLLLKGYPYTYDLLKEDYKYGFSYPLLDSAKSIRFLFLNVFSIVSTLITSN